MRFVSNKNDKWNIDLPRTKVIFNPSIDNIGNSITYKVYNKIEKLLTKSKFPYISGSTLKTILFVKRLKRKY